MYKKVMRGNRGELPSGEFRFAGLTPQSSSLTHAYHQFFGTRIVKELISRTPGMVHSRRVFSFVVATETKGRMTLLLVHLCLLFVVRWTTAACAAVNLEVTLRPSRRTVWKIGRSWGNFVDLSSVITVGSRLM